MPTPDEVTALPPSPPLEATSSPHNSFFAICPPEDVRDGHALRDPRVDTPTREQSLHTAATAGAGTSHRLRPSDVVVVVATGVAQTPTPEPEAQRDELDTSRRRRVMEDEEDDEDDEQDNDSTKTQRLESNCVPAVADSSPSRAGSPDAQSENGGDSRVAQGSATTPALDSQDKDIVDDSAPRYISYPPLGGERIRPDSTSSFLRPGSKFRGTQRSDRQVYDVQVEIKDVDLAESFLCGYLRIQGLTDDHPMLTTFFEGEIIGSKYAFRTSHASWNSSEKIDMQHWQRFPAYRPLARYVKANPAGFELKKNLEREHLFMRWKECFLVPDHRVKSISGASFEGFYYICFDQRAGSVSGIYFHAKSEKFQQLDLHHYPDAGCLGAVEFR